MRLSTLAVTSVLISSVVSVGQAQLPDTPAVHQCAAWLESFNRGDANAHREFLQKNYPSALPRLERQMEFRQRTGGFNLKKVEESTPTKTVVLVEERSSDQMGRLTVEVQAEEPHQITSIDIHAIPRPAEFALPHLSQSELISGARKEMESQVA